MTDKPKHAPLPWVAVNLGLDDTPFIKSPQSKWEPIICQMTKITDYKANAEFIVKAVNSHYELVEALEDIKNITDYQPANYIQDHEFAITLIRTVVRVAEGALKKARGQ